VTHIVRDKTDRFCSSTIGWKSNSSRGIVYRVIAGHLIWKNQDIYGRLPQVKRVLRIFHSLVRVFLSLPKRAFVIDLLR
jgi:hypothetical protein